MYEFFIAILIGIFIGTITGLTPGIHINLIGAFIVALSLTAIQFISPLYLIIFITAMSITHTFIDFIPSILLGCPDTDTELSILPGHQLLKQGLGYQAIILTAYGSIGAIIAIIIFAFPVLYIKNTLLYFYPYIKLLIPGFLILISLLIISMERKKYSALLVFILTGILGYFVLNFEGLNQPLLPLLTGLFGASNLILSIKNKTQIPKQEISFPKIESIKPFFASLIASPLCCFLPGMGSGQAAIIGNTLFKCSNKGFLTLIGMTNTLVMSSSFIFLFILDKTRTGSAHAIKQILTITNKEITLILITIVMTGFIAFFILIKLSKIIISSVEKINYTKVSLITLGILFLIVLLVSKITGILVLITATITGIYSISQGVKRTNMMGCLIIPTIIFYLV